MHVDRCFTLRGIGTVVTGTLWAGAVAEGQEVRIEPGSRRARVRGGARARQACPEPRRPASASPSTWPASSAARSRAATSCWLQAVGLRPTYLVDAARGCVPGARPLRRGTRVHVHHGTRETPARVAPL